MEKETASAPDNRHVLHFLMNPKKWWIPLLFIFAISISGVVMIGYQTYYEAPAKANFKSPDGETLINTADIEGGQAVFLKYALMEYGSMFGDGAGRGPDFTAEALHRTALYMNEFYMNDFLHSYQKEPNAFELKAIEEKVKNEIKRNTYSESDNSVQLTEAQAYAVRHVDEYYQLMFLSPDRNSSFPPPGYITDKKELSQLASFFYWGAWVCGVARPGETFSYTHNWPFDTFAGNTPTTPVMFWSIIGILGFILGLGITLYYYGQFDQLSNRYYREDATPVLTLSRVNKFMPTPSQRATYKFFFAAAALFLIQVMSGLLTINEFVDFIGITGIDISGMIPIVISRSWHILLSLLWIAACWIASSIFVLPLLSKKEVPGQKGLVNLLFWMIVVMVGGSMAGIFMGPKGLTGDLWYWFGHQGWEFVELGKAYQFLLLAILALWSVIVVRGALPALQKGQYWALPNWLMYSTVTVSLLFLSGFVATPSTNFVIADFWRWCVVHMWAEAFFEVFTTIIVAYLMVIMGLVGKKAAMRIVYLAMLLFLGSGLLGISHNFYWNAKPVATMALGSVFSTLQVVPLILLTIEAWRFRNMPDISLNTNGGREAYGVFAMPGVFLFLVGVNFWNFFGAGVFGLTINLPIVNYYEHGTYLTVNHGHAALFGVYGNLSLAGMLFVCNLIFKPERWNLKLVRTSFWSLNIGLLLMVALDLFPVGAIQLNEVIEKGLWYVRSNEFITGSAFKTLTWLRGIGSVLFLCGGVIPLVWFVLSRAGSLKPAAKTLQESVSMIEEKVVAH